MLRNLLEYVEIKTKVTSVVTFVLAFGVMLFLQLEIKVLPSVVFFCGMFLFDLTATSINNYIDTRTNGESLGFSRSFALKITCILLILSISSGIYLFYLTDFIILFTGMLCFGLGIFYTFGAIPISRQPYGEIISGIAYGYFIPFLLIHSNNLDYLISGSYNNSIIALQIYPFEILKFILIFMPPTLLTSTIMLANNTCDLEVDIKENRFTLAFYLGITKSLILMNILYVAIYLSVVLGVLFNLVPWLNILLLLTVIPVIKNIKLYRSKLIKDISDIYIIKNFVIILFSYALLTIIGALFF